MSAKLSHSESARKPPRRVSRAALGVGISVLLALGIASLVHVVTTPTTYAIDPTPLVLTQADVGADFAVESSGGVGPSVHSEAFPQPYEQYFLAGWGRYFVVESALVPPGSTELATYEQARGYPPTDPPTIFGPFVADHHGFFEVEDSEISYSLASAAHPDYLVSHPGPEEDSNYQRNYDDWRTYPIQLGDEADAWGGIRLAPANPPQAEPPHEYEEQTFRVRWRHGPIVSEIFVDGAHDITLDTALHFAHIVDARIASALQHTAVGGFHAAIPHPTVASVAFPLAVCCVDRRAGQRPARA